MLSAYADLSKTGDLLEASLQPLRRFVHHICAATGASASCPYNIPRVPCNTEKSVCDSCVLRREYGNIHNDSK